MDETTGLRKIFGCKKEDVAGDWRNVHHEGLHDMYCSANVIEIIRVRRMRWVGHAAHVVEKSNTCRDLAKRTEGNGPHRRPRPSWEYDIKMYLEGIQWEGAEWIDLTQDSEKWRAVVDTVMNFRFASAAVNLLNS
jgi:hypothetical protein